MSTKILQVVGGLTVNPDFVTMAHAKLPVAAWTGSDPYVQTLTVDGVTASSKIDIQIDAATMAKLHGENFSLVAQNNNSVVKIYAIGAKPSITFDVQLIFFNVTRDTAGAVVWGSPTTINDVNVEPETNVAPISHASTHKTGGTDPLTASDIGAASASHTHKAADIGAASSTHSHSVSDLTSGTLSVARGGTGQTTLTPAVGTAAARAIYAGTTDMTAGTSSLATGTLYFVYE